MSTQPNSSPGTVSTILWHFTGGPAWNASTKRQSSKPKPPGAAYKALLSILRSKTIRVGNYKETARVIIPKQRRYNVRKGEFETVYDVPVDLESSPVCCLSDIPAPHLRYHAYRYGQFAVGFYRDAVIRAGFNPVLYTLEDTAIIRSVYEGFSTLEQPDVWEMRSAINSVEDKVRDGSDDDDALSVIDEIWQAEAQADLIQSAVEGGKQSLADLLAFMKTFSRDEFSTVYCEREWRSTSPFTFSFDDVAFVVVPRRIGERRFFAPFVKRRAGVLGLPRRVPVVPWDDLVEH